MAGSSLVEGAPPACVKRELEEDGNTACVAKGERVPVKVERRNVRSGKRRQAVKKVAAQARKVGKPVKHLAKPKVKAKPVVKKEQPSKGKSSQQLRVQHKAAQKQRGAAKRRPARPKQVVKFEVKKEKVEQGAGEAEEEEAEDEADDEEWKPVKAVPKMEKLGEAVRRKSTKASGSKVLRDRTVGSKRRQTWRPTVKQEPPEDGEPISFEARLPFYIAQCKAFQLAKRPWKATRPCCLANCFLRTPAAPKEGKSCYEVMSKDRQSLFRKAVVGPEAQARAKCEQVSLRLFHVLMHPEREPDITVRKARIEAPDPQQQAPFTCSSDVAIGGESPTLAKALALAKARQETLRGISRKRLSGVPGVKWDFRARSWVASWKSDASREARLFKHFPVRRYMTKGKTEEEADDEALHDAIVFRERLVLEGKVKVAHVGDNKGIFWNKKRNGWDVFVRAHGKKLRGGHFRPINKTPEAVERARQAAVECRVQLEMRFGRHGTTVMRDVLQSRPAASSQAPAGDPTPDAVLHINGSGRRLRGEAPSEVRLKRQKCEEEEEEDEKDQNPEVFDAEAGQGASPVGVTWRRHGCHWRVQMFVNGKVDRRLFKPKEDKPEELERELLAACRQDTESAA